MKDFYKGTSHEASTTNSPDSDMARISTIPFWRVKDSTSAQSRVQLRWQTCTFNASKTRNLVLLQLCGNISKSPKIDQRVASHKAQQSVCIKPGHTHCLVSHRILLILIRLILECAASCSSALNTCKYNARAQMRHLETKNLNKTYSWCKLSETYKLLKHNK